MTAVLRRALGGPGSLSGRGGAEFREAWPVAIGRAVWGRLRAVAGFRSGEERRSSRGSGSAGRLRVAAGLVPCAQPVRRWRRTSSDSGLTAFAIPYPG